MRPIRTTRPLRGQNNATQPISITDPQNFENLFSSPILVCPKNLGITVHSDKLLCGTGALAGRRRAFRLNKIVLMVAPFLPPEGARRVAGGGDRIAIGTPGSQTSYDPPRMGRKSINAPMEGLCRCKPMRPIRTLRFLRPSGA